MNLYGFEQLNRKLDQLGFPKIQSGTAFQVIKGINFIEAYKAGSISFEDDGIYLEYEGEKYRGYMFIKEPWIEKYGSYPKFHLTKCQTIQEFISTGRFETRYDWSNSHANDLIDKTSGNIYKDEVLKCCSYCKKELFEDISDTNDFYDTLDKSNLDTGDVEVDIFGYVRGKEKISKDFRTRKNFTCEVCSIRPKSNMHRRWWHTHHLDGDKTNNLTSNLKCLCIVCHSNIDPRHTENFLKGSMTRELERFKKEYLSELKRNGNRFI